MNIAKLLGVPWKPDRSRDGNIGRNTVEMFRLAVTMVVVPSCVLNPKRISLMLVFLIPAPIRRILIIPQLMRETIHQSEASAISTRQHYQRHVVIGIQ